MSGFPRFLHGGLTVRQFSSITTAIHNLMSVSGIRVLAPSPDPPNGGPPSPPVNRGEGRCEKIQFRLPSLIRRGPGGGRKSQGTNPLESPSTKGDTYQAALKSTLSQLQGRRVRGRGSEWRSCQFNRGRPCRILTLVLGFMLVRIQETPLSLADTGNEERLAVLEERLARLERTLGLLLDKLSSTASDKDVEATRSEVKALAAELGAAKPTHPPATASVEHPPEVQDVVEKIPPASTARDPSAEIQNVPYAGYMETHLNHDGLNPTTFDFHRFVLLFGHGFGDRIRFWSELEFEHGFIEGREVSGELVLEQAYLDFLVHPKLNFRAGTILAPVGIINERHEPPSFNGVERPFVDTFIIPSTWFGSGGGIVGDLGKGFAYKAYLMTSLDASGFSAEEGFRGGRQNGFFENARNMAPVGRLEYRGVPGLNLGTSFWTGRTGFNLRDIEGQARILEFDGRYRKNRLDVRGQFATTHLNDALEINRAVQRQTGVNPNIAESMRGFYFEGAVHLFPIDFKHDFVTFYRYENFDTQYRMPQGFLPLKQFDRSAHVVGVTYYPYPDVAIKFDYDFMRNGSEVVKPRNQWNFGIGWWF